jgi:tetratricopeptide (TPR) repeat protein
MKTIKLISITLVFFLYVGNLYAQILPLEEAKKLTTREQYPQAEEMFKKLLVSDPGIGDNYYYYGENEINAFYSDTITRSLQETVQNCKKLFEKGIEKDAQNPLNYVGLARINNLAGKKDKVTENVAKVNAMIPPMTTKIKKIEDPKRYALILSEMAKIYIIPGKTDTTSALPLLRRAVQADPQNANIYNLMGDAYLDVRDVNNAIAKYNQAQTIDPNSPLSKLRIGYLYIRAKNPKASITFLEEALKIDPNFAPVYKELGYVYSLIGKTKESNENYLKYIKLAGDNIPAKYQYIISLFKAANYKECIKQINDIFAVDSSINSMNRVLAYAYCEEKNYQRANYYIQKFLKNIGNDPEKIITKDYIYYGKIAGELGQADKADEKFRTVIKLDPNYVDLYTDIAFYQSKAQNYKKAIAALEDKKAAKAAKLGDYYYMGRYFYSDENYEKAFETFDNLLQMTDPKLASYEMYALTFQGYAGTKLDTTFQTGKAKPVYEKMIQKSLVDSVKYSKNLVDAYSYMATFYLLNKEKKDFGRSKCFYLKVQAIDPANAQAGKALTHPDIQKAKLPENCAVIKD